jgi:protocatechuate 3,4-dioxygenase beta subunit
MPSCSPKRLLCLVAICALALPLSSQTAILAVREADLQAHFAPQKVTIELLAANRGHATMDAAVTLELIDADGLFDGSGSATIRLEPGTHVVKIEIPVSRHSDQDTLRWDALRYVVAGGAQTVRGVVALAAITPDLYELRVAHPISVAPGQPFVLRAHATNPVTHRVVPGVTVQASFEDAPTKRSALTDAHGEARFNLILPASSGGDDSFTVHLQADKNGLSRQEDADIRIAHTDEVLVQTDKTLYQPGQTLHVRALMFDAERRALAGIKTEFTIRDPDDTVVFRASARTNRFAIAAADWEIPPSLRLGDYSVRAESDDDNHQATGTEDVRISRYELPTFTVAASSDRSFYMPGQDAKIDINASYLFGRPVTRGTVRLVHQEERRWDFREQKWEVTEDREIKGTLNASGRFTATVSLGDEFKDLAENTYRRYEDATFAAYVTDETSGRTEQRRLTLRASREPIHIYVLHSLALPSRAGDVELMASAFYPDGSPVNADLEVSEKDDEGSVQPVLGSARTNRYGLVKFSHLHVRGWRQEVRYGSQWESVSLVLKARDGSGRVAEYVEEISRDQRERFFLRTDRSLYKAGEPIQITVLGQVAGAAILEVQNERGVLRSQSLRLRNGTAGVVVPYQPEFKGLVTISVYSFSRVTRYDAPIESRSVLFPFNTELKVNVATTRSSYRPGEELVSTLRVVGSDGAPAESALGLMIVDKAVEERLRSDQEFGGQNRSWGWPWSRFSVFAGITFHDLEKLDLAEGIPEGLDLVAEAILYQQNYGHGIMVEGGNEVNPYLTALGKRLAPVATALDCARTGACTLPKTEAELNRFLARNGIDFASLRDPWEQPYHVRVTLDSTIRTLTVVSSGPDKTYGTDDDFDVLETSQNYFAPLGRSIDRAVKDAHARSGGYVRDYATLRDELLRQGVELNDARDPWGGLYRYSFGISNSSFTINVEVRPPPEHGGDKERYTPLWTSSIDYFSEARARISQALADVYRRTGSVPRTEAALKAALASEGIDFDALRDPWGHPYYAGFGQTAAYGDAIVIEYSSDKLEQATDKPVTQLRDWVYIRSAGADGNAGTPDDFGLASFSQLVSSQSASDSAPRPASGEFAGSSGAVGGNVLDPTGAVIAGARVTATRAGDPGPASSATTDSEGHYVLKDLAPGEYEVRVESAGFRSSYIRHVPVHSSSLTQVDVRLRVGATSETVEVSATAPTVDTTSTMWVAARSDARTAIPQAQVKVPSFTPTVRQYFPETLYWEPSLITSRGGVAKLRVKLADTVTTWKLSAFASTLDGHVGVAEKDIRAFQPFFVDHDPPRVLTVGDEITLPVIVRNYTEKQQSVLVSMKTAPWFTLRGTEAQTLAVPAGDSSRALFSMRIIQAATDAPNRVTALSAAVGDAIEKPVNVHPDGEERATTVARLVHGTTSLDLELPASVIAGSLRGELKLYPDLMSHVMESVEASLVRPYGCAEQTISSTFPSLMVLRYNKQQSPVTDRARRYLRAGYDRLLNYREAGGGFSYWGHGNPDPALTAYAVRFLTEAADLAASDPLTIRAARSWLIRQQQPDGSWAPRYGSPEPVTAYVAHVLAAMPPPAATPPAELDAEKKALQRALAWLAPRAENSPDPYVVALLAQTRSATGDISGAVAAAVRLQHMAHSEGAGTYWSLETNTAFYGWGMAGRIETTAMVMQALREAARVTGQAADQALLDRALMFLLSNQDRYGVWSSGQATVNVLEVMLQGLAGAPLVPSLVSVVVNGRTQPPLHLSRDGTGLLLADLTTDLAPGANHIEVRGAGDSASVRVVARYYVPWTKEAEASRAALRPGESDALGLRVNFSSTEAAAGEPVQCSVHAERIGHRGYGMLLAEIGLPPGADVDRSSLERAVQHAGWDLNQYDVLPDRVILYLWPRAGGTDVNFSFTPRFAMHARSSQSSLYDYYNPEAQATVAPATFSISERKPPEAGTNQPR